MVIAGSMHAKQCIFPSIFFKAKLTTLRKLGSHNLAGCCYGTHAHITDGLVCTVEPTAICLQHEHKLHSVRCLHLRTYLSTLWKECNFRPPSVSSLDCRTSPRVTCRLDRSLDSSSAISRRSRGSESTRTRRRSWNKSRRMERVDGESTSQ